MSRSAYPTASDVITALASAGILTTDYPYLSSLAAGAAESGQVQVEKYCNRVFLAGSSTARYFDPVTNGRTLWLPVEATAISSVVLGGSTLTANEQYWLQPYNYSADGIPINRIEFATSYYSPVWPGNKRSLVITGTWGYGSTIPEPVWQAMLAVAQWNLMPAIRETQNIGAEDWREADVSEKYGADSSGAFLTRLANIAKMNLRGFVRPYLI